MLDDTTTTTTTTTAATPTTTTTTSKRKVKIERGDNHALTMHKRFAAKSFAGSTVCTFFEEVESKTAPGGMVRMKGGQAPSAYGSERGAAGQFNLAIIDHAPHGITWAELVNIADQFSLGKGGKQGNADQRVVDHVRSFHLQADFHRAKVNGLHAAVKANGWNVERLPAVLIDGKEWNGNAVKRCILPDSVLLFPLFLACHFKRTPSLAALIERKD
ncbi:MAG: hypothetical protein IKW35_07635 [Paludibacteraceae bacterium]|nr:hypothetical protein [Paludibacteraceae bacterium]